MTIRADGRRPKSPLHKLADGFGIEVSYRDAPGKIRKTSEDTKRRLSVTIAELLEGSKINELAETFPRELGERGDRSESAAG